MDNSLAIKPHTLHSISLVHVLKSQNTCLLDPSPYSPKMQGLRHKALLADGGGVRLELTPSTNSPLSLDLMESTEMRIQRLISENPVIIFSKSSCCMCHVMRRLLATIGVHPTVIQLDDDEIGALTDAGESGGGGGAPAVFIGGTRVGGLESLVELHLSNQLVPRLVEVGALRTDLVIGSVN